jgi:VanZ family protein
MSNAAHLIHQARLWRWLLVLLLASISVLALHPDPAVELGTGWDKTNHLLAFGSLGFVAALAVPRGRLPAALAALLAYGGLIELLQLVIPGRTGEWADLLPDALGLAIGAALSWLLLRSPLARTAPLR